MLKGLKIMRLVDGTIKVTPQYFAKSGGTYTAWGMSETRLEVKDAVEAVMIKQAIQLSLGGLG